MFKTLIILEKEINLTEIQVLWAKNQKYLVGNGQRYVDRKWLISRGPEMAKIPRGRDEEHA